MKQRDFLAKQVSKNLGSYKLQDDLKLLRKRVTSKIWRKVKEQGLKALASNNSKDSWNYINMTTFTGKVDDDSFPPLSTLNYYYASVVQATTPTAVTVPLQCDSANSFHFSPVSTLLYTGIQGTVFNQAHYSSRACPNSRICPSQVGWGSSTYFHDHLQ